MLPPTGPKKQTQFKAYPERSRMGQFPKSQNEKKPEKPQVSVLTMGMGIFSCFFFGKEM